MHVGITFTFEQRSTATWILARCNNPLGVDQFVQVHAILSCETP
eukprot:COSAG02_NODE_17868_length_974_cov_35.181714_3_plen_43_part_01